MDNGIQLDDLGKLWGVLLNQALAKNISLAHEVNTLIQKLEQLTAENERLKAKVETLATSE